MKLDVVIEPAVPDAAADALERLPRLARLLARGDPLAAPGRDLDSTLAALFGLGADVVLPNAALLALGEGLEAGAAYWLRADPVCLLATSSRLTLNELPAGALTPAEAQQLAAALRDQFAADDAVLFAPHPQRWYLRLEAAPDLRTLSPAACAGTLEESHLPAGADSPRWRRMITEAQMLLHAHPVNAAREAAGKPPANALWPWGGGCLPQGVHARYDIVWSDDLLVRGLARAAGTPLRALPGDASAVLADAPRAGDALLVLPAIDAGSARAEAAFEGAWVETLACGLTDGRLRELAIMAWAGPRRVARRLLRAHLRRWWRGRRALAR